jgi:ATP-binding cassette subfamily B protein
MNTFKKIIKNNFLMLKYVNKYCPNHKWITMVKSILTSTTSVIVILLQKYTIDLITNGVKFSFVICIILSSFLIMIITSLINNYFENVIIAKNSQILFKGLQVELFNKAKEVDLNCYDNRDFYNKYTLALHQADTRALAVLDTFSSLIGSLFGITSLIVLIVAFKPI